MFDLADFVSLFIYTDEKHKNHFVFKEEQGANLTEAQEAGSPMFRVGESNLFAPQKD
jgi:hypothetical protein